MAISLSVARKLSSAITEVASALDNLSQGKAREALDRLDAASSYIASARSDIQSDIQIAGFSPG